MLRYVPTSSTAAEPLTQALWRLTNPAPASGETVAMFAIVQRESDGSLWLEVDTEFTIPVHADAVLDGLADILQPWIDAGNLPPTTNSSLEAFIYSKRGGAMTPWEAFPQLFHDLSKTAPEIEPFIYL